MGYSLSRVSISASTWGLFYSTLVARSTPTRMVPLARSLFHPHSGAVMGLLISFMRLLVVTDKKETVKVKTCSY